uniref:Uncharacterized protein n=1 Tax=Avena sativa TaxID=4498 RepID=A0ACD5WZN6_AVESA
MESRCPGCFHPRCANAAACAACQVCDAARTSPFGVSPAKPEPPAHTMAGPFGLFPAHGQTSLFGVPAATPNPFLFSFPPTPPEPAQTSPLFGQPWATSTPSAFNFTPPTQAPGYAQTTFPFHPLFGSIRTDAETFVFDDDEPVEKPAEPPLNAASNGGPLVLETHCELPAVARGCARDSFAVLVHAKAPGANTDHTATRAPLDLVTVLDVSGSMAGRKLALLKEAMGFVVDKLGPADRLSVVSFSCNARRVSPLMRMSDAGKASAKLAVQSLVSGGGTDILKGLQMAADVLDGRRHRNAVASVVLLSDGQDNDMEQSGLYGREKSYQDLVPRSLAGGDRSAAPIHTFGFGTDHDAAAMHAVAEATGGTFSFIENQAVVQDAFAQCIGGLLSVVAQETWIAVTCPHPDVRVRAIKSGRYESRVAAYGRAASVDVGELYADEERRFLLFVDVPSAAADDDDITRLVKVSCTYKDTATRKSMEVAGEEAFVRRSADVTSQDQKPSTEVEMERFRIEATEDIAAARAAAERGDHGEAARILDRRRNAAPAGLAGGDARCAALVLELGELSARVASRREYEQTGRACVLSGMSSHAQQRASSMSLIGSMAATPVFAGSAAPYVASSPFAMAAGAYATPAMKAMVDSSRETREQRQQQQAPSSATTTMPNSASIFAPNNGSI